MAPAKLGGLPSSSIKNVTNGQSHGSVIKRSFKPESENSVEAAISELAVAGSEEDNPDQDDILQRERQVTENKKRKVKHSLSPAWPSTELEDSWMAGKTPSDNISSGTESVPPPRNISVPFTILPSLDGSVLIQLNFVPYAAIPNGGALKNVTVFGNNIGPILVKACHASVSQVTGAVSETLEEPKKEGFAAIPKEIRDQIYKEVFVADRPFMFRNPNNFCHTAALLRTCKAVHARASNYLYGRNKFVFERQTARRGAYYDPTWTEVGYKDMLYFLKSVGNENLAKIRHIGIILEDASRLSVPPSFSADDRRFTGDETLLEALTIIARQCKLRTISLTFMGKRMVTGGDRRFLDTVQAIKADLVRIPIVPVPSYITRHSHHKCQKISLDTRAHLIHAMTRPEPLHKDNPLLDPYMMSE